jgi:hypothetical protein
MSNPTTPFGWQMPTATNLVTDLPADFEVFGQAVATSMADLLGGASGYILSKASATDMDFAWIANDQGDITAVTAGTGISGGGTSGAVTITNSMATAIDAKGDLVVGTGADAFSRLAVGATNGMVLTVDSAEATGLKYAVPTAPPTIKTVRKSSDQTVTSSTTLVNDSQLLFAVAANETYIFQAWLYTYAADGTPDIKVTFTGPAGSTVFWSSSQVIFNAGGSTTLTVVAPGATTADLFVDSNLRAIQLYGTILNGGTAGNLQFQFAQNTSSANGTSVKAGSSIFGIKV